VSGKFVVSLTRAKDDTDRATVAFVVANAAIASEKEVVVFLNIEGTRLSQSGYPDDLHEAGFSPCFKKRALHEDQLIPGAKTIGGATLVEFMGDTCPSLSY
jgi:predicted peroxiredoxin